MFTTKFKELSLDGMVVGGPKSLLLVRMGVVVQSLLHGQGSSCPTHRGEMRG